MPLALLDALPLLLADAVTPSSVLLNMGLPGVVIIGLAWWIVRQSDELKELRKALDAAAKDTQAAIVLRVTDAQAVTTTSVAFARDATTALTANTAALTALKETGQNQADAIRDLTEAINTTTRRRP